MRWPSLDLRKMNLNPKPLEGPKILQDRVEQPINLAPVKVSMASPVVGSASQPITLHGHHMETATKSAFTTLRLPTPPRPVVGSASIISSNVPSSQILSATKPSPRHVVTTTVYPVMSLGGSGTPVPMASIIRGTLPQTGTALYSSHIPRGAAAVASISAGPKSAVATPILRPTHTTSALQQMAVRAPALNMNRIGMPTVQKTTPSLALGQVIDIPKVASGGIQMGRPIDASAIRGAKPVHISQPVVQQIADKGYFKATTATVISAAGSPLPTVLRQPRTCASTCVATIAPAPTSSLRPVVTTASHVSPALVPTAKSSVAIVTPKPDLALAVAKKGVVIPNSALASVVPPTTIPVAKVHPQPSTVGPRPSVFEADGTRGIYIAHPSPAGAAVVLSENRSDSSGPVRFTSLSRPYTVPQAAYFYESYQVQNAIPVRPYSSAGNTASLRTGVAQHANTTQSVPTTNPVVVTVDTPTLHPVFTTAVSEVAPPTVYTSSASLAPPSAYSPASHTNHSTSPRPSILRKRASDGVNVVKKNLMASLPGSGPASPHPEPPKPPPKSEVLKENGCSNAELVEAAAPQLANASAPVAVRTESPPENAAENGAANGLPPCIGPMEASPRKKPRKQQLAATELLESHSTDGEEGYDLKKDQQFKEEYEKCVAFCKRPSMSLLNSYRHTWKSRQNHFQRYTDVKPKDDKKCTVNELANQKGVVQKTNGWKIYHLTTQLDDVADLESSVHSRLSGLLEFVEKSAPWKKPLPSEEEKILVKVSDLIKGNLQRSKIAQDQVTEMKQQVMRMLEHKPQIVEIIGKYVSKRPIKKKTNL